MIEKMDVVTMRIPFPTISSDLAVKSHMYICMENGTNKKFVKCQTFKPTHRITGKHPFRFVDEKPDINRNPFQNHTTIDCDKTFNVNNVKMNLGLRATMRNDVCSELFDDISNEIQHPDLGEEIIDSRLLAQLNYKISIPS
ncbi:hypothetical protein [Peribacillus frigoritolerans]|uniref:hypothetical protein n=1 Tax=Peribacillus frigoritolerans TaxID=450367 RepID=UPI0023DB25F2|nr:hypothetical protein [Peribacillus frigoritolerans]MDF1997584.1 hypothetical protein [Peribacillus frigoritolerans]